MEKTKEYTEKPIKFYLEDEKYTNTCGKCCSTCTNRHTHSCEKNCIYEKVECVDCKLKKTISTKDNYITTYMAEINNNSNIVNVIS